MYDEKCRQLIANVLEFMLEERNNLGPVIPVHAYTKRASAALKISEKTLRNIIAEQKGIREVPKATRDKKKKKSEDVDDNTKVEVRNIIYDMYKQHEFVSIETVKNRLAEKEIYHGSKSSVRALLLSIGKYIHYNK